jgi:putative membrane protein insertion efficiency factor
MRVAKSNDNTPIRRFGLISVLVLLLLVQPHHVSACQSCLLPPLHRIQHSHPTSVALVMQQRQQLSALLGAATLKSLQQQGSRIVTPVAICVGVIATQRFVSSTLARGLRVEQEDGARHQDGKEEPKEEKPPVSSAMVATIGVYKNFISPLLPPACRFLPTCSQYGVQAIEEFGPSKGAILTAWRLLRCSPFGGKGYDPPKWPPVFYTYGSY